jgi:hypothetical protein
MKKSLRQQITEFAIENKQLFSWREIAEKFSIEPTIENLKQMSDWLRYYYKTGNIIPDSIIEQSVDKSEETTTLEGFKIKSAWQSASGKMLFSYIKDEDNKEDIILEVIKNIKPLESPIKQESIKTNDAGIVIFFTDAHINKLTLDGKSPEEKANKYYSVLIESVNRAKLYHNIKKCVYIVGSDFFNSDTYFNTTTNGTPQDNALHFDKAFELGLQLSIKSINYLLSEVDEVQIVQLSGNHDVTSSFYLCKTLEAYYRTNERITFNSMYTLRKCITIGKTSIMLHHGNVDLKYIKDMFANYFPFEYTNKYVEAYVGDKHNTKIFNDGRLIIRQFPSLSTPDKWTDSKNFYGLPGVLVNVYDYELGRIMEIDIKV